MLYGVAQPDTVRGLENNSHLVTRSPTKGHDLPRNMAEGDQYSHNRSPDNPGKQELSGHQSDTSEAIAESSSGESGVL